MSPCEWGLRFLGVGSSRAIGLGTSAAVLERAGCPVLLIDCGPDTPAAYATRYAGQPPAAVFITHSHLDHIGGLENLFFRTYFAVERAAPVKLYVPVRLVEVLHRRVADYPGVLAEGGVNFWDAFQLVPVSDYFWHAELLFSVFAVRHHGYQSAYGVGVEGLFLYTGDTRPVPEVVNRFACRGETVFHDCGIDPNPAHTGLEELAACYRPEQLARLVLYHYDSEGTATLMQGQGYRVAHPRELFALGRAGAAVVPEHPSPAPPRGARDGPASGRPGAGGPDRVADTDTGHA